MAVIFENSKFPAIFKMQKMAPGLNSKWALFKNGTLTPYNLAVFLVSFKDMSEHLN
jgi:hypothetical protein